MQASQERPTKHLFILNPVAGAGRRISVGEDTIQKTMSAQNEPWEIYKTTAAKDATRKVKEAAATGEELRVYACGGDGTLSECVNGAVGFSNVAVTHFPLGTGNDFIKSFTAGKEHFFHLPSLIDGKEITLDLIRAGNHYGINICSIGIDARIAADVHKYSGFPLIKGKRAYFASTTVNVIRKIAEEFEVEVNGKTLKQPFTLICICNGRSYGGAFTPVPDALPDDGLLDILLVDKVSRLGVAGLIGKYGAGRYKEIPHIVKHVQSTKITIRRKKEFIFNVDGESPRATEITFEIVPKALRFIAPQNADFSANANEQD